MIISSSVIIHYVHYCNPNLKQNVIKIQGHVWLRMLHICQNFTFIMISWRDSYFKKTKDISQNAQTRRSEKYSHGTWASYLLQSIDMEIATMCAYSQSDYVLPHWKFHCDVVPNVQALIFLTSKQMLSILTPVLQLISHLSSYCMLYRTWQASVNWQENLSQVSTGYWFRKISKNMLYKRASEDGDNHFLFSYKFIYSSNSEVGVSHSTHANTGYE